ncbi:MAG: NUDIX hydrolase [Cytophagaceae bacterium]
MKEWQVISSENIIWNKWCKVKKDVVKLPGGSIVDDYYVNVRPDVVLIVAVTKENKFLLVRQYKHGLGEIVTEVPGGVIDEEEASPEVAARRELMEETGFGGGLFTHIATLSDNPTKDTNKLYVYLAQNVSFQTEPKVDEMEDIDVLEVDKKDIMKMILNGDIYVSGSISALSIALQHPEIT